MVPTDEDDTFERLRRVSWQHIHDTKPENAGRQYFLDRGWTWEEFRDEWVRRIKQTQQIHAQKIKDSSG